MNEPKSHSRRRNSRSKRKRARWPVYIAGVGGVVALLVWALYPKQSAEVREVLEALDFYQSLPSREWTEVASVNDIGWWRQGHAGAAYDSRRGAVLVFGSDTHGDDWENIVREFNPALRTWQAHGTISPPEGYTVDAKGQPIAEQNSATPWAMHTYDGLAYDPTSDALVVAASVDHTPNKMSQKLVQRPWLFNRENNRWQILSTSGDTLPSMFGASLVHDENRDTLILCQGDALWELGADRALWRKLELPVQCELHHQAEFEPELGRTLYFGTYRPSTFIGAYSPPATPGGEGRWATLKAEGCPKMSASPVTYDRVARKFVIVANNEESGNAQTFLYDANVERCETLPIKTPALEKLNFMLIWHQDLQLSLLITGKPREPITVWALKL